MKNILIILILACMILTGCFPNNYYAFNFNTTSTSQCAYECEQRMDKYMCMEATPSYENEYINGEQIRAECSCYIRVCLR